MNVKPNNTRNNRGKIELTLSLLDRGFLLIRWVIQKWQKKIVPEFSEICTTTSLTTISQPKNCWYGAAGSGKTTLLMQVAMRISDRRKISVYFIKNPVDNLKEIIVELERINDNSYCIFYDRLEAVASELSEILESGILIKGLFIGSERQHKWEGVAREHLYKYCDRPFHLHDIDRSDADIILKHLERFGPWTRLRNMRYNQRIHELFTKSKRQLLIGLLESTLGIGYEKIIENEYSQLGNYVEQLFLTIIGYATIHRYTISEAFVIRALSSLNVDSNVLKLSHSLSGIIKYKNGRLLARHPVYVQHLFDKVIDIDVLLKTLIALLGAYTVYKAPVIKRLNKTDSNLFKALFNHKFLKYIFKDHSEYVLAIYKNFEKPFENDGLFLLQYGLALRDFNRQPESLEKLQTAYEAHPQTHTEHALAQQEMIIALETDSKSKALDLFERAKERLEHLDKTLKSRDTYPIVTLSEGHTEIVRIHQGESEACEVAKHYANIIESRRKNLPQDFRLKKAWKKLTTFAVTGEWIEDERMSFI